MMRSIANRYPKLKEMEKKQFDEYVELASILSGIIPPPLPPIETILIYV